MAYPVTMAGAFATIAGGFSAAFGGPYHAGVVRTVTDAVYDDGGSIIVPGSSVDRQCKAQVDSATEAMRGEPGYTERDVRLLVLSDGLVDGLDTDAEVRIAGGPHAGQYSIQSVSRDPFGIYFECRGRRAEVIEYDPFFGTVVGLGQAAGNIHVRRSLSATSPARGTTTAVIRTRAQLVAVSTTAAIAAGYLTAGNGFSGTSATSGRVTAALRVLVSLRGASALNTALTGSVITRARLIGNASGNSTATAYIGARTSLSGTTLANGSITAAVRIRANLVALSSTAAAATGTIRTRASFTGTSAATSAAAGSLSVVMQSARFGSTTATWGSNSPTFGATT